MRVIDRVVVAALTGVGVAAVLRLADWWFRPVHVGQPVLYVLLSLAFWYAVSPYRARLGELRGLAKPSFVPSPEGVRVAIFTTSSPGEPLAMFERTLAACRARRAIRTRRICSTTRATRDFASSPSGTAPCVSSSSTCPARRRGRSTARSR